jgi:deoxyadenosine/deoxycytidine kinase
MIKLTGLVTGKKPVNEQENVEGHLLPEDITYFKEKIDAMINSIEEMHQEIGMQLEVAGDETGFKVYDEMVAQLGRYMEATIKSLEYCDKYFTRMEPRIKSLTKDTI